MPVTIGRFEVIRRLGRGGSGTVYLASDPRSTQLVAIKVFDVDPSSEERLSRIVGRLGEVARLRHRHIAAISDVGDHDGQPFVATEYIDGETLADVLGRTPPPALVERLALAEQLCEGLAHAHAAGIVHGHLAPGEILIDAAGVLKIRDFAIPAAPVTPATTGGRSAPRVNYLAPEQIEGAPFDRRADIFAVGAVLYEMIALRLAFPGGVEVLHRILAEGPVPLTEAAPGVDAELVAIVERALARVPDDRYQTAGDIARDIERVRVRLRQERPDAAAAAAAPRPQAISPSPASPVAPPGGTGPAMSPRAEPAPPSGAAVPAQPPPAAPPPQPHAAAPASPSRTGPAPHPGAAVPARPSPAAPARQPHGAGPGPPSPAAPGPRSDVASPASPSPASPAGPPAAATGHGRRRPAEADGAPNLEALVRENAHGGTATFTRDALNAAVPIDDVQFTVYRPRAVRPERRSPMLVYTHLGDARDPRGPRPIEQVRERAQAILGPAAAAFRDSTTDGRHAIPAGGEITLLPEIPGVTFTPERHVFRWTADIHEHRFDIEAGRHLDGQVARGQLTAYLGVLLLAEVPLAIRVDSAVGDEVDNERSTARPYRKIFASYSRRDEAIVEQFERYVEALGDRYLRDVRNLRAGERWEDGLRRLIEDADVFQLFWSWNAMRSPNVRREWEYAISLNRRAFVRPTYWEMPLPEAPDEGLPPPALRQLHFHCMASAIVAESSPGVLEGGDIGVAPHRRDVDPAGSGPVRFPAPGPDSSQRPAEGSGRTSPPAWDWLKVRPARIAGIAAGLMLAVVVAVLVAPTGSPPTSTAVATPDEPPPASAGTLTSAPVTGGASGVTAPNDQEAGAIGRAGRGGSPPGADTPAAAADVAAVRGVLSELAAAYRARDAESVRRLWPSAPRELGQSLVSARSYELDIVDPQISITGAAATATASRRVRIVTASGEVQQTTQRTTFVLARTPTGWIVTAVR